LGAPDWTAKVLTPSLSQNPPASGLDRPEDPSAELISYARDLEREGNFTAAAELYLKVAGQGGPQQEMANQRLAALEGKGGFQLPTLEVYASQFLQQALDPAMVFSFLVAGSVGAATARGISSLLRGRAAFGKVFLQSVGSLAAEVPAFVGTHRFLSGHSPRSWGKDLTSAGIFLGTLKAFHLVTPLLAQSLAPNLRHPGMLTTGGSLAGIFTAQGLEEAAGLVPHHDLTDRFRDTLATFFQLQVAGKILSPLQTSSLLSQNVPPEPGRSLNRVPLRLETLRRTSDPLPASLEPAELARWSPLSPRQAEALLEKFESRFGYRPDQELTQMIVDTGVALEVLPSFASLLVHSEMKNPEFLRPALARLRHMAQKSDERGIAGNYFNWTTRLALQTLSLRQNRSGLRLWLHHLYRGGSLEEHEAMLAQVFPELHLQKLRTHLPHHLASSVTKSIRMILRRIPLSLESIYTIQRFMDAQDRLKDPLLRKLGEEEVWDTIELFLQERPEMKSYLDHQLKAVAKSPVGFLRFHRLYRLMLHEPNQDAKFKEFSEGDYNLRPAPLSLYFQAAPLHNVANSVFDGYVNHRTLTQYLGDLYGSLSSLTDPVRTQEARLKRNEALRRVWPENGPLNSDNIVMALEELGDPISLKVAEAVKGGEVEIKVLLNREFNAFVEKYNKDQPGHFTSAVFAPHSLTGEKDALVIRQVDLVSHEVFPEMAFKRIQSVIHEFEHFQEPPASPRTPPATFREEMTAHARTLYWRALHGDTAELEAMLLESPQSLGMTLRDRVDSWYLPQPQD
jgi:hypothetical protein